MKLLKKESVSFQANLEGFETATTFIEELLERNDISKKASYEVLLIFEALLQELSEQEFSEDTRVELSGRNTLGGVRIVMGFEGKMFIPISGDDDLLEGLILDAFGDKVDYSYRGGYNIIHITAARSYRNSLFLCVIAALLALVVYLPIHMNVSSADQKDLLIGYIFPLEQLFTNAVLMVGAPLTLFSLLKNLTDTYVVSQRSSGFRILQRKTLATSVLAILLAIATSLFLGGIFHSLQGIEATYGSLGINRTFAEVVPSLLPSSIFQPFDDLSPVPLIALSLLTTYALCSTVKYFDVLKNAVEACYALFARMLRVVMAALPLFCFISLMDVMLDYDHTALLEVLAFLLVIIFGVFVLVASYAIRLKAHGIAVIPFAMKLVPLLRENIKISSAIDAAPFNIRYCAKHYGLDRKRLAAVMPVLAEVNLDGNCFIIMLETLLLIFITNISVSVPEMIMISLLVLFLSFGAPNQPGSILVGTLIILSYLEVSSALLPMAIYAEAFLGWLQNLSNVTGDVVIARIECEPKQPA